MLSAAKNKTDAEHIRETAATVCSKVKADAVCSKVKAAALSSKVKATAACS